MYGKLISDHINRTQLLYLVYDLDYFLNLIKKKFNSIKYLFLFYKYFYGIKLMYLHIIDLVKSFCMLGYVTLI